MELREGAFYLRQDGHTVGPAARNPNPLHMESGNLWDAFKVPDINGSLCSYYPDGRHGCNRPECFLNLVEEVERLE